MSDFIITDVVSAEAIESVRKLTLELNISKDTFADYAAEIARASMGASQSFTDLAKRVRDFEQTQAKMQSTQQQYNAQMEALRKELAAVKAQMQQAAAAETQQAAAASQSAQAAEGQAQSLEAVRQAALEQTQALEAQRAAMLSQFELEQQTKQLMDETLGTRQQNLERLAATETELRNLSAAMSQVNADQKAGVITDEEATKKRAVLLEQERELKVSKSDLQRILKNEEKAAQEADGSYKQLSLTLSRMKDAYKMLNEEQRNSEGGKRLLQQIQELDTGLKGAGGTMGEFQRNVGGYEQALLSALGVNNRFAVSILNITRENGGGISGFFKGAATSVKSFGAALMTLLTNPVFLAIAGIGATVAGLKWLYDYNQGMAEATRLTKEFSGTSGDEMTRLRNEIQAVADTFGKDFKETLAAADTLVQQYGISWSEAIDLIRRGFAAGADLNGTFLSQIERFAPALRDAGIEADKLVALIAQTRSGIFNEQGMQMILMAQKRLTEMSSATAEALRGIGLDAEDMSRKMADGTLKPIEALRIVSQALNTVGENSKEAANVMQNVFGRQGAQGGRKLAKELATISDNLDEVEKQTGEWGVMQTRLAKSQEALNDAMSDLFDLTDHGWETMILQLKVIVNEWLAGVIRKVREIRDWFVNWYNSSEAVRGVLDGVWNTLKGMWNAAKLFVNVLVDGLQLILAEAAATGDALSGMWQILSGEWEKGFDRITGAVRRGFSAVGDFGKGIAADFRGLVGETLGGLGKIASAAGSYRSAVSAAAGGGSPRVNAADGSGAAGGSSSTRGGAQTAAARAEAERVEAIQKQLNATRIQLIEDGYERERATIEAEFKEKIDAVKGNSVEEIELRANYYELMTRKLAELEKKREDELLALEEANLQNRLDTYREGGQTELEYLRDRVTLIEVQRKRAVIAAEREGQDVIAVSEKYYKLLQDAEIAFFNKRTELALQKETEWQAKLTLQRSREHQERLTQLAEQLQQGLITRETYNSLVQDAEADYALQEAQAAVTNAKKQLEVAGLTAEQRKGIEQELAEAEIALEDAKVKQIEEINAQGAEAVKKRIENAIKAIQMAQQFVSAFSSLSTALFDAEAKKLEDAQDTLDKAYDAETSRIEKLQEKGAISTEEAERRKQVAERKHAAEQEKIEKKKAELKRRQAIMDKAANVSAAIMNTAVAIMQAWKEGGSLASKIAQTALISALGAVQVATIVAQPIPKYAHGTDSHSGGLAIVGDAGKQELVITGGRAWVTPATPTLVDMPRGAYVHPDATAFLGGFTPDKVLSAVGRSVVPVVNVNNDYSRLERATHENTEEIRMLRRQLSSAHTDNEYRHIYDTI